MDGIWLGRGCRFFYASTSLTHKWINYSPRLFEKKVFFTALIIHVVYVLFSGLAVSKGSPSRDRSSLRKGDVDARTILAGFSVMSCWRWGEVCVESGEAIR